MLAERSQMIRTTLTRASQRLKALETPQLLVPSLSSASISSSPPLTIADISPKWALRLRRGEHPLPCPLSLTWFKWSYELTNPSKCIVGEAYGYPKLDYYNCRECNQIGWKFMFYFTLHLYSKLENNMQRFTEHWNKKHGCKV
jgi:hypothetical protein